MTSFKVGGIPAPQGSKTGRSYCGQEAKICPNCHSRHLVNVNMVESSAKVKPWREAVAAKARQAVGPSWTLLDGPVVVVVVVILKRPQSHYRAGKFAHLLRDDAPGTPYATAGMDVDKLARAVMDALTGVVYTDDKQVVRLSGEKLYAIPDGAAYMRHPGALITVTPYSGGGTS